MRLLQREWIPAVKLYQQALEEEPDNLDLALKVLQAQRAAHTLGDAMVTLERVRRIPGAELDARVDIEEATTAELPISYEGTSAGKRPMLVSGTSPPEYDIGTSDRSSAPLRSALNCEFTLTSDEFG